MIDSACVESVSIISSCCRSHEPGLNADPRPRPKGRYPPSGLRSKEKECSPLRSASPVWIKSKWNIALHVPATFLGGERTPSSVERSKERATNTTNQHP